VGLNPELGPPFSGLSIELGVAIDQRGKEPWIPPLPGQPLLVVCDLELGVCTGKEFGVLVLLLELQISPHGNNELEFSPRH